MSNYITLNPVPSTDPRDLDDNATIFDQLLNSEVSSVNDRLSTPRKTWWQMEQDAEALVSPNVAALAALSGAPDRLPYFTGAGALSLSVITSVARSFLSSETVSDQRSALSLGSSAILNAGVANGVATLGADGLLPVSQLPPLAVSDTTVVSSQAAMLALAAQRGDVAIRSDLSGAAYILAVDAPSVLSNWVVIQQNLGVALQAISAVTPAANSLPYFTDSSTASTTVISSFSRTLLDDSDDSSARTTLGAAARGANSDITSISSLSTPLSVAQGGSGGTSQPFTRSNSIGTVSQTSGVPTGSIFESGGTVNGTGAYTKFADGKMSIQKQLSIPTGCTSAAGAIFRSAATTAGDFPVSFVGTPIVTASGSDSSGGGWAALDFFGSVSSWGSWSTRNHISSGTSCVIYLSAEGRWF